MRVTICMLSLLAFSATASVSNAQQRSFHNVFSLLCSPCERLNTAIIYSHTFISLPLLHSNFNALAMKIGETSVHNFKRSNVILPALMHLLSIFLFFVLENKFLIFSFLYKMLVSLVGIISEWALPFFPLFFCSFSSRTYYTTYDIAPARQCLPV